MSSSDFQCGPLPEAGIIGLRNNFLEVVCGSLVYGIYATLAMESTYILVDRGLKGSRPRQAMLAATLVMFAGATALSGMDITGFVIQTPTLGPAPYDPTRIFRRLAIAELPIERINFFFSDSIVVWRAWILWPGNAKVRAVLTTCLLASLAGSIVEGTLGVRQYLHGSLVGTNALEGLILLLPLLATNICSTSLVACKAWHYRKSIRANIDSGNARTKVEKVLILLVESGFLYCFVWMLYIMSIFNVFSTLGEDLIQSLIPYVTAIYPTVIILFVALEKSHAETMFEGSMADGSVHFAAAPSLSAQTGTYQGPNIHIRSSVAFVNSGNESRLQLDIEEAARMKHDAGPI